ncbi:NnrS family protein [Azospirillum halopraeferens]|uniref:NnrS family protein n=1 Tax=Azospirillum halopraeferens TaxID=34010 RepID=UPI001FE219FD|nr:NnrS family protein [Azospirillum halopraeferens]
MLSSPHRPMFLAAGVWAVAAVVPAGWDTGFDAARTPLQSTALWHAHEMLFGFAAAGFAGYALTAMGSWSGPRRLSSRGVPALLALWILARLSAFGALGDDPGLIVPAGVAFLACVTWVLSFAALRSGSTRGAVQALFALFLTGSQGAILSGAYVPTIPVFGLGLLLSVVGGRMVAAFTWNRIERNPSQVLRFRIARLAGVPAAVALALTLALEAVEPGWVRASASMLLLAAIAETVRLSLWLSRRTVQDKLLGMLQLGYFWLPVGLALVALARVSEPGLSESDTVHALAAGAVACSIYAVAARAVARRADRLRPTVVDVTGFVLLWAAAALRVFGPPDRLWDAALLILWCAAWTLFVIRHGAALLHPTPRPVFSGPKS